jgi:hypothetical protein
MIHKEKPMPKKLENELHDEALELEEAKSAEKHNKKTIKSASAPSEDEMPMSEKYKKKMKEREMEDDEDEEELEEAYTTKSELMAKMVHYASKMHKNDLAQAMEKLEWPFEEPEMKKDTSPDMSKMNKASIKSATAPMMKEDIDFLFGSEELTEDFKEKATTLFEAAVQTRLDLLRVGVEEEYEQKLSEAAEAYDASLTESIEQILSETEEKVNDYLSYAVQEYIEENRVEIENTLKAELTESFLQGLKGLFDEHYVEVPDDKLDIVEGLAERVEELENEINEQTTHNIELKSQLQEMEIQNIRGELAEGLTDIQREKFFTLSESLDYTSPEHFRQKAGYILESFKATTGNDTAEAMLNEEVDLQEETVKKISFDPSMSAYANAIKKTIKR